MGVASVHIVRHYGPVGGMENYVYQLTRALARKGHSVTVICERVSQQAQLLEEQGRSSNIQLVELGNPYHKPRWLAQWRFAKRVHQYLSQGLQQGAIIHSHERSYDHHVTTFHGPPFLIRRKRLLDILSPRIHMWTFLERNELLAPQVKAILPNSILISEQLKSLYPDVATKVLEPAYPGVEPRFTVIKRVSSGATIGFLGREWQRKGLDIAVKIVTALRSKRADIRFLVAGCEPDAIRPLFVDLPVDSYELLGWVDDPAILLGRVDLLLHPARVEPFGMVVAEANASGIPVVVSDQCGVAPLIGHEQGKVCTLGEVDTSEDCNITRWVDACYQALECSKPVVPLSLSWDKLADQHSELYVKISQQV